VRDTKTIYLPIMSQVTERPVRPLEGFLVAAFWRGGHWRVWEDIWPSHERAQQAAKDLHDGWRRRTVLRIRIPTEET